MLIKNELILIVAILLLVVASCKKDKPAIYAVSTVSLESKVYSKVLSRVYISKASQTRVNSPTGVFEGGSLGLSFLGDIPNTDTISFDRFYNLIHSGSYNSIYLYFYDSVEYRLGQRVDMLHDKQNDLDRLQIPATLLINTQDSTDTLYLDYATIIANPG